MTAFELASDKQFILPSETKDDYDVFVCEYRGDPNQFDFIRPNNSGWDVITRVGISEQTKFKALKVFGVTIEGKQLAELCRDLSLQGAVNNQIIRLIVNRLGQCLIMRINNPTIRLLRINDYFGWSKYGVILPQGTPTNVWSKCDMYNGATIVDTPSIMIAVEQSKIEANDLKKEMEEKQKRMDNFTTELEMRKKELECMKEVVKKSNEVESLLKKMVQDKEKELEIGKVDVAVREKELECTKEVVKMGKEMENLLMKSVQDKERELETVEDLVLALKQ
ncbi:hypothetical protein LINGRAHAP2_LOCUS35165 [Linum grandiflorum]